MTKLKTCLSFKKLVFIKSLDDLFNHGIPRPKQNKMQTFVSKLMQMHICVVIFMVKEGRGGLYYPLQSRLSTTYISRWVKNTAKVKTLSPSSSVAQTQNPYSDFICHWQNVRNFRSYFRTKCNYKFRTYFRTKCKFRSYFRKKCVFRSYFRKKCKFRTFCQRQMKSI